MKLISFLIPSKNRQNYLIETIKSFGEIDDFRIEVIIHDNSDSGINPSKIKNLRHSIKPDIRYFHSKEILNMHENFEKAFSYAKGKYICFLGDDDMITKEISKVLDCIEKNKIDCLNMNSKPHYWWKDVRHNTYNALFSGLLRIPNECISKPYYKKIYSHTVLQKCSNTAGTEILNLPSAYFGIVHNNILKEVKKRFGSIFPGPTPDMSSAVAIANLIDSYYLTNVPYLISGTGASSGGGSGVRKKHNWKLSEAPWFEKKYISKWDKRTPKIACGPTLWAEGYLQVTKETGKDYKFNHAHLYAKCLHQDAGTFLEIKKIILEDDSFVYSVKMFLLVFLSYNKIFFERLKAFTENIIYQKFSFSFYYKYEKNINCPTSVIKHLENIMNKK